MCEFLPEYVQADGLMVRWRWAGIQRCQRRSGVGVPYFPGNVGDEHGEPLELSDIGVTEEW